MMRSADIQQLDKKWHVVRVKANAERKVAHSLLCREIESFLPMQKRPRRSKNGGSSETPLFPGYVFASFDSRITLPVVACPGVVHILCRGNTPEVVDPSEMYALRTVAREAHTLLPHPLYNGGQTVTIRQGPLEGVTGTVIRDEGGPRLIVSVSLLQRSVIAEVDRDWLDPAGVSSLAASQMS